MVLMSAVCIEVFKRYILNAPTACIFDLDNMLYGTLFMICGAYTLAQDAHVRGDFRWTRCSTASSSRSGGCPRRSRSPP